MYSASEETITPIQQFEDIDFKRNLLRWKSIQCVKADQVRLVLMKLS